MISSCKGIVLRYFKSSQDSVVVKILTDVNGLVSFFVKNTSSKKKCKTPLSLLQPFSLINLSDIRFKKNNLAFLNEISLAKATPPFSMTIKLFFMFASEVLTKVLHEGEKDSRLFNYIWHLSVELPKAPSFEINTPLLFLIELSNSTG